MFMVDSKATRWNDVIGLVLFIIAVIIDPWNWS